MSWGILTCHCIYVINLNQIQLASAQINCMNICKYEVDSTGITLTPINPVDYTKLHLIRKQLIDSLITKNNKNSNLFKLETWIMKTHNEWNFKQIKVMKA